MNNREEFIRKECSKCKNTNEEDCNIVQKVNGEYDCVNKKVENNNIERVIEYIDNIIEDSKKYPYDFIGTLLIIKDMLNREI